jgi:hypothetical protein
MQALPTRKANKVQVQIKGILNMTSTALGSSRAPPGPSLTSARRAFMHLQSRIGTFCHPQDTLLISRQLSREIGSREIANPACAPRATLKLRSPIPEVNGQRLNPRDFPVGKSRMKGHDCLPSKTPNADARCHVLSSTLTCGTLRDSRPRDSSVLLSTLKTPKCRVPSPRDLVPPVPPTIDGSD